jgi:hypothetical protein
MTLDQWLQEATGIFPAGVQKRLAQEYAAHLEDSVAVGGVADPVALLGPPYDVQSTLKKSYLTSQEFGGLSNNFLNRWYVPIILASVVILGFRVLDLKWLLCVPVCWLAIWWFTHSLPDLQRNNDRSTFINFVIIAIPLIESVTRYFQGRELGNNMGLNIALAILSYFLFVRNNTRIHRTLRLEHYS